GIHSEICNFLFYKDNSADPFNKSHIKIEHSRVDADDYNRVISAGLLDKHNIDYTGILDSDGAILKCYRFFRKQLLGKSVEELGALHNSMFNEDRLMIVLIVLAHNDINEQAIFDTINRAGVRLSAADIIKNNLFKKCLDSCTEAGKNSKDVCELYDHCWAELFYPNHEDQNIWDDKRGFGNVQRTNAEFLLYCVAAIKWGKGKDIFANLEKVFEDETAYYTYNQLKDLVQEILDYGNLFKEHVLDFQESLNADTSNLSFKFDNHVDRLLLILEELGVQMFYPYILKRLQEVGNNVDNVGIIKDFAVLESFVIRRRLSFKGVTDYAIKCDIIMKNGVRQLISSDLASVDGVLKDSDLRKYASKVDPKTAKVLLFCIELFRRRGKMYDVDYLEYKFTLEHIMPQKWQPKWSDVLAFDEDGISYEPTTDEGQNVRKSYLQAIGNLTLLRGGLNASVSNNIFRIKVNGSDDGNKRGYKEFASLSLTKEIVDRYDAGDIVWDEKHIQLRSKQLCDEIVAIWPTYAQEILPNDIANSAECFAERLDSDTLLDPIELLKKLP
ncbi:MAG: HNH endonuclease family protein, partial [Clostridia bacterium]